MTENKGCHPERSRLPAVGLMRRREASFEFAGRTQMEITGSNVERSTPNLRESAGGGARTHTALRPLDFESSASANSATPAFGKSETTDSNVKLKCFRLVAASLHATPLKNCA